MPPLDLVILDGPHGYPFPELEYALVYPFLRPGALFVLDDIHIPTLGRMWDILREDSMFAELDVIGTTGFLRRTGAPPFTSDGDDWWLQAYNERRYPNKYAGRAISTKLAVKRAMPAPAWRAASALKGALGRGRGGSGEPD